jgi:hypothetical protein
LKSLQATRGDGPTAYVGSLAEPILGFIPPGLQVCFSVRVSDAGLARTFAPVQDSSGPASESLRRTNPRDSGEQLAGYGDLVTRRCWQKIILRRLVRAGAADDGGPGSARVAEGLIWE